MEIPYTKSFAKSPVSIYWSPRNTLKPNEVSLKSHLKCWFNCPDCNHEFEQTLYVIKDRHRCPYCSSSPKLLCNDINCKSCYNKSFASQEKSKYWYNNNIEPRFVFKSSSNNYYNFKCNICKHIFNDTPNHITSGRWCPYCSKPTKLLCNDENCDMCFKKSFASHLMSKCWSNKNNINPRRVLRYSNIKYIFNCIICKYEFSVAPNTIQGETYCPMCVNKTERLLYEWLKGKYENVKYQVRYEWCRNEETNYILPFDFEYNNIIIELDGAQHFRQVCNWKPPEIQIGIDKYKMNCALENNKHIIRISQEDVFFNKNNWDIKLIEVINELITYDIPSIRYIGIDSKYYQ